MEIHNEEYGSLTIFAFKFSIVNNTLTTYVLHQYSLGKSLGHWEWPTLSETRQRVIFPPLILILNILTTTNPFYLQLIMETPQTLSPNSAKDKGEWTTPVRAIIRAGLRQGKSQRELVVETYVPRRTVRRILKQEYSCRERKRKLSRYYSMF